MVAPVAPCLLSLDHWRLRQGTHDEQPIGVVGLCGAMDHWAISTTVLAHLRLGKPGGAEASPHFLRQTNYEYFL